VTEWNAADYSRQAGLQRAMAGEDLALLDLEGSERVLDVGCGDGRVTAAVAARVPRGSVLGVDPSRDMVAYASAQFAGTNLRFEVGDARRLPYRAEFDFAVSFNALHWVPEQEAALRSIRAALRPDGRALLRLVPAGPRGSLEDVFEETRGSPRWEGYFAGYSRPFTHLAPEEYRALAGRCGFRVEGLHVADEAWDFKTRAAFEAFCHATFVEWTRRLPQTEWPAFIADVLDRYRPVACERPGEENTFKFYQMDARLTAAPEVPPAGTR
jgi:trans-aconitate 2-methyltransferase